MHILENVTVWRFFRWLLERCLGLYRKRFAVIRSFGIGPEVSLLDVGCGTGECAALAHGRYVGIDMDAGYIERAQRSSAGSNRQFICADLNEAAFGSGTFDVGLLMDVVHHLTDVEAERLFRRLNEVVSGSIVVCDPVRQSSTNLVGRFLTFLDRGSYIRSRSELLALLDRVFTVEQVRALKILSVESVAVLVRPRR